MLRAGRSTGVQSGHPRLLQSPGHESCEGRSEWQVSEWTVWRPYPPQLTPKPRSDSAQDGDPPPGNAAGQAGNPPAARAAEAEGRRENLESGRQGRRGAAGTSAPAPMLESVPPLQRPTRPRHPAQRSRPAAASSPKSGHTLEPEAGEHPHAPPQVPTFSGRCPGQRGGLRPAAPRLPLGLSRGLARPPGSRARRVAAAAPPPRGREARTRGPEPPPRRKRPPRPRLLGAARRTPQAAAAALSLRKRIPPRPRQPRSKGGGGGGGRKPEARDKGAGLGWAEAGQCRRVGVSRGHGGRGRGLCRGLRVPQFPFLLRTGILKCTPVLRELYCPPIRGD